MTQKAAILQNDQGRPNLHSGIHQKNTELEYGMPTNINVLIGEAKHK